MDDNTDASSSAADGSSAARCWSARAAGPATNRCGRSPPPRPAPRSTSGTIVELRRPTRAPTSPQGRLFVANADDYLFALSQKCPHLGCRVPFCESSGRFECPCHGSKYDLGGEWIEGPAPRGMDRYELTLDGDNVVVDTRSLKPVRRAAPSGTSRRPRARPASPRPDDAPRTTAAAAVRARRARAQPRPLPRMGPRLHGRAHRRLRRLPGARAQPAPRRDSAQRPRPTPTIGTQLFAHQLLGVPRQGATVGGSAPVLNSKEFLKSTTDDQISTLIAGGVPGTEMPAWSLAFGGTLTDEQIRQITTYLRSLEPNAPSVPTWRRAREGETSRRLSRRSCCDVLHTQPFVVGRDLVRASSLDPLGQPAGRGAAEVFVMVMVRATRSGSTVERKVCARWKDIIGRCVPHSTPRASRRS